MKLIIRNIIGFILSTFLILKGERRKAIKIAKSQGIITCIYTHNPKKELLEKCVKWLLMNYIKY